MDNAINYLWIDTEQKLAAVCEHARKQNVVALDTEFVRIRTFFPKLGLIQLFDGKQVSLIDPLNIHDFSPFVALLADKQVVKVLHACSEDLDVFHHYFQQLPEPMLDTQIMAGFAGIGVSLGFAKLVQHYQGIELDKGASRTDWLARPLSDTQLQYAAADVWYLLPLYHKLVNDLANTPWQQAAEQECELLLQKRLVESDSQDAYKEIGNAWQLNPQQLAVLRVLAKWRLEEAQKRDLALNFVVKEHSLWEIAKTQPRHTATLLEFMHSNEVRIHGKKILWLVEQGKQTPVEEYPKAITRLIDQDGYKEKLKAMQQLLVQLRPADLAPELLASKRQLNQLFSWYTKGSDPAQPPELLKGWRERFGLALVKEVLAV